MSPDLINQLVGLFTAVVAGGLALMVARERSRRSAAERAAIHAEREMDFQGAAMEFAEFVDEWQHIINEFESLIKETNVDRILVLRAWNGAMRPRWTTAILQVRDGAQDPITYQHYELDADYVDRLKQVTAGHPIVFKTSDIPDCGIKQIYLAEGVTESMWAHIGSKNLLGSESRAITYCSFSTANEEGLTPKDLVRCRIILGRLKGIYLSITPTALDR